MITPALSQSSDSFSQVLACKTGSFSRDNCEGPAVWPLANPSVPRVIEETRLQAYSRGMSVRGAQHRIREAVSGWHDVTEAPHRFGGVEFRLGKRELGHVHGDWLVDIPFPKQVRDGIIAAGEGRTSSHPARHGMG